MAKFNIFDYNKQLLAYQKAGKPIGPSSPGYVQGSANMVKTQGNPALERPQSLPQGQVLGASTGGGGGGGDSQLQQLQKMQQSGGLNPAQLSQFNQLMQQYQPEQPQIDFDALIRPAIDALEQTVPTLQKNFDEYQTGQETAKQTQLASSRQGIGAQEQLLGQARTQQSKQGESAVDEARRQFAEIQQGLQARYGGTTGTGAFAGELAGRQTLGNIGDIRQGLSQAMQQIDDKLVQVKEIGRVAEQDIEQQTQERVRQAREQLNLQIADIRQRQGVLQADKARMTADSIQQYQNSVNQFKLGQQNFLRDLYVRQTEAENQLKASMQKAQSTAQSFTPQDFTGLAQQLTPAGLQFSASGKLGPGGTFTNPSFNVGPVTKDKQDDDPLRALMQQFGGS